jgi:predicted metal-dependent peptidase
VTAPRPHVSTGARQLYADPAAAAAQCVDKIAAARVWLLKEKPFFGVLARALRVEPTLAVPAFRLTPDDRVAVNALVVLELGFPALCARFAHLALHAALGAFVRRGGREPLRWNVAHDLAIAPLLRAAGLPAGPPPRLEDLPVGASAEEYFLILQDIARPDGAWCDLADPPPPPDAGPAGTFTRRGDGEGGEPGDGGAAEGGDGEPDDGDDDEPREDAVAPVEARARDLQWKMRLAAALEEERASGGKTFGETPAWIDELVRATIAPPPSFDAVLQRSIAMLARTDRSYLRPSRRLAAMAGPGGFPDYVAMPGRRVRPAGRLVAVIDTSASMPSAALGRFLGALASVATAEGFDEVRLVQADAEVTRDETRLAAELLFEAIAIVGRGGTDFGPALLALADESRRTGERFSVLYLTDLDGRFPDADAARALDVWWVVPGKPAKMPPFGRVIGMGALPEGERSR